MDGRKALEIDPSTAPAVAPATAAPGVRLGSELPVWLAVVAGLLGPALAVARTALEPAALTNPDEAVPLVAMALGTVELAAWVGAAWAGLSRRPAALGWAVGAAALGVIGVVACPTTGHHSAVAGWWYAELGLCLAALAAGVVALRWWAQRT
jgi:hypothetical protein